MAETRKPDLVLVLKKKGTRSRKVELFNAEQWPRGFIERRYARSHKSTVYRVRAGGRWFSNKKDERIAYDIWQLRDVFWRAVKESL